MWCWVDFQGFFKQFFPKELERFCCYSVEFSGGECCFAGLELFPKDQQILPGIIKALPTFFIIILVLF